MGQQEYMGQKNSPRLGIMEKIKIALFSIKSIPAPGEDKRQAKSR